MGVSIVNCQVATHTHLVESRPRRKIISTPVTQSDMCLVDFYILIYIFGGCDLLKSFLYARRHTVQP